MKFLPLIFILFAVNLSISQEKEIKVQLVSSVPFEKDSFIGMDVYDNLYSLYDNVFFKEKAASKWQYKNVALGKIEAVDLQNPLQIVLFYKQMNSVVLLDNQLNETVKINFSETNPELIPNNIGLASQNRFWLFDFLSQRLGLYDFRKNHFSTITNAFSTPIAYSQSDYNFFYWIDTSHNMYVSNLFGNIHYLGNLPDYETVRIVSADVVLLKNNNILNYYNLKTKTSQIIPIGEKTIKSFCLKEQILSIFTDNEIRNYKIILP